MAQIRLNQHNAALSHFIFSVCVFKLSCLNQTLRLYSHILPSLLSSHPVMLRSISSSNSQQPITAGGATPTSPPSSSCTVMLPWRQLSWRQESAQQPLMALLPWKSLQLPRRSEPTRRYPLSCSAEPRSQTESIGY